MSLEVKTVSIFWLSTLFFSFFCYSQEDSESHFNKSYLINLLKNPKLLTDINKDGKPDYWVRLIKEPLFKPYSRINIENNIDDTESSVRLQTNGTNVLVHASNDLAHDSNLVMVGVNSNYHLQVLFKTQECTRDEVMACVGVSWLDRSKQTISTDWKNAVNESAAGNKGSVWRLLGMSIRDVPNKAVYAKVLFGMKQKEKSIVGAPLRATAWFKDVRFVRQPKIHIITNHEGRIFPNQKTQTFNVEMSGLEQGSYDFSWSVCDYQNRKITGGKFSVESRNAVKVIEKELTLDLGFKKGWFKFQLTLTTSGDSVEKISEEEVVFGIGKANHEIADHVISKNLGIDVQDNVINQQLELITDLTEYTNAHHVFLSLWNSQFDLSKPMSQTFSGEFVTRMNQANIRVIASLGFVPPEIQGVLGVNIYNFFTLHPSKWKEVLRKTGERYSEIESWVLGNPYDISFIDKGSLIRPIVKLIKKELSVSGAMIGLPLDNSFFENNLKDISGLSVEDISFFTFKHGAGGTLPSDYADMSRFDSKIISSELVEKSLDIKKMVNLELVNDKVDVVQRISSMVFGVIHLLNTGADEVNFQLIDSGEVPGLVDKDNEFKPEFFVFRMLNSIVKSLKVIGKIDLPNNSNNLIIEFSDEKNEKKLAMIIWNDDNKPVIEDIFLGENLKQLDVMGNKTVLKESNGLNHIPVTTVPSFLIDLNDGLIRTRLSVILGVPNVDTRTREVRQSVELINYMSTSLSGTMKITIPNKKWKVIGDNEFSIPLMNKLDKRIVHFNIRPDQFETTGKEMEVVLDFEVDGSNRPAMKIFKRFNFESNSMDIQFYFPETIQDINEVKVVITNISGGQIDVNAYDVTRGNRKKEVFLGTIKPDGNKKVIFYVSREDIEKELVIIGARQQGGFGRFVNRKVVIREGKLKDVE